VSLNNLMTVMIQTLATLFEGICREHPEVRLAYLFGSHARNEARPGSDVDIGIVVKGPLDPLLDLQLADRLAEVVRKPVDVVVLNHAFAILQHEAIRDGVRLYEVSSMDRRIYELTAFKDYVDAVYFQEQRIRRMAYG
jgi:predicted nucleotidyltransferase